MDEEKNKNGEMEMVVQRLEDGIRSLMNHMGQNEQEAEEFITVIKSGEYEAVEEGELGEGEEEADLQDIIEDSEPIHPHVQDANDYTQDAFEDE